MDLLERLIAFFAEHGYAAVFMALLLCGAGLPLPEDITLVAGGVISGLGFANAQVMVAVTVAGVLAGDAAMFLLGRHFGTHILQWKPIAWLMPPHRYAKVQDQFARYGNRMMFFARFLPGMRTAIYIAAGATHRVSFWRFLLLDGAATLVSVPIWVYVGYVGANRREWLGVWIGRGQNSLWLIAGVMLLVALWLWLWRRRWRRRNETKALNCSELP